MTLMVPAHRSRGPGSAPAAGPGATGAVLDRRGRPLRDLRISVTDRCNFRCGYCMPRSHYPRNHAFLPVAEQLSAEEITRLSAIFVALGVTKVRLTGGEPLLRRDLVEVVRRLAQLGLDDLALTTNGSLLRRLAAPLAEAGLRRVTVSLDSLDPRTFRAMSDADVAVTTVVEGIEAALSAGLQPVKLNCVVRRGMNDGGLLALVEFARARGLRLRFIEYMDVGTSNGWRREEVVPADEILDIVAAVHPLEELPREPGAVARRFRFLDSAGELGVIASVTKPFCGDCSRARLSSDGRLYTCLFAVAGLDLRGSLRSGATDEELLRLVTSRWEARTDRYSEVRASLTTSLRRVEMSYIGG